MILTVLFIKLLISFKFKRYSHANNSFNLVLQILDRKNLEIEDVKNHYKAKISEMEEAMEKQERRGRSHIVPL